MRENLEPRREAETFDLRFPGLRDPFAVTVGRYADGRVGEVFVNAHKRNQLFDDLARDTAILISFALQHGATLADLSKALTRDGAGAPLGLAGAVIDAIEGGAA